MDPFVNPEILFNVPQLAPYYCSSSSLVAHHVSSGMLPGRVRVRSLTFPQRYQRLIIGVRNVLRFRLNSPYRARTEIIRALYMILRRGRGGYPVPICVGLDTWEYRSYGE